MYYQMAVYPKAIDDLNEALNHLEPSNKLENRRIEAKKKQWQTELNRLKRL
jgi:beta-barrel assembly-enhancing protease